MTRPLALRKVTPAAPGPLAFEEVVYEAERLAGAAYVLSVYLEGREEPEAQQTAVLLTDALLRQAALLRQTALLRLFMERPDDPAEAPEQTG